MKNKYKKLNLLILSYLFLLNLAFGQVLSQQRVLDSRSFQVYVNAQHFLSSDKKIKVRYTFSNINNSASKIYRLRIGERSLIDASPAIATHDTDNRLTVVLAPKSWTGEAARDEAPDTLFVWQVNETLQTDPAAVDVVAQPAKTNWSSFIVESPRSYPSLYKTYAAIDVNLPKLYSSTILKIDQTPPSAKLSSNRSINKVKNGYYDVNLSITAKDNYDLLPEIIFDSLQDVTTTSTGAVVPPFGAAYTLNTQNNITTGAYPTVITIPADAKSVKKYKINYKVTDASDNQITVSTVVTIPKK